VQPATRALSSSSKCQYRRIIARLPDRIPRELRQSHL
jgi:hypothetical protein